MNEIEQEEISALLEVVVLTTHGFFGKGDDVRNEIGRETGQLSSRLTCYLVCVTFQSKTVLSSIKSAQERVWAGAAKHG